VFVLCDKSLKFNEKTLFVLSQKWCWGLILLAIFLISFSNTILIVLWPKQPEYITLPPSAWGAQEARPGLKQLQLPVDKVVVTDTGDEVDSCTTKVSLLLGGVTSVNCDCFRSHASVEFSNFNVTPLPGISATFPTTS
jgi:hypothetical protein